MSGALEVMARQVLVARKRDLIAGQQQAERETRAILQQEREPDWEDQAQLATAADRIDRMSDNERAQLAIVEAALERLDSGTWGWCVVCGRPMDEARLRAAPEALRCVECTNHTS